MRPSPLKNRGSNIAQIEGSESTPAVISRHLLLGAIADDVTGATDLCSALQREGMRVVQTFGVLLELDVQEVDAVVVALKSRTAPAADAVRDSLAALSWLEELGAQQFFFKICSTFDSTPAGNIGPVGDALLEALGADITVVCPAYPENGRTLYQGHLFVGDRLLSESSLAHHPLTPMTDSDIVRVLGRQTERAVGLIPHVTVAAGIDAISQGLADLRGNGSAYAVVDALTDHDLQAIGAACAGLRLVIGGSGVASGLPQNFRRPGTLAPAPAAAAEPVSGPTVVLAGSCSAATQEQVRRMAKRFPAFKIPVDGTADVDATAARAAAHLEVGPVLLYTTAPPDEVAEVQARVGPERAQREAETLLGELARRAVAAGAVRVVVAGGETAGAVLGALGIRALATGDEIAPGVPWMHSLDDPPLALALKSGNFGGPDFFLDALEDAR
jgi:3-dehydrotetronate 4-kinase